MDKELMYLKLQIEILITRREAMIAENEQRKHDGLPPAFGSEAFGQIEQEFRVLLNSIRVLQERDEIVD